MSAVPIFIPPASMPPVLMPPVSIRPAAVPQAAKGNLAPAPRSARLATTPVRGQLTDRGIAVVLLLVAMILTTAVIVIGVTAVRVTSADYDAGLHGPRQAKG